MSESSKDTTPVEVSEVHTVQRLADSTTRSDSGSLVVLEGRLISGSTQKDVVHVCVSGVRILPSRIKPYGTTD